ncbi:MAG: extensin family protein [Paracoccaceae bacterium]|nr:extensin family protein [Paracoccaceae bacterium]
MDRAALVPLALVALLFSASACSVRYDRSAPRAAPSTSGYPMVCKDPALRGEVVGEVPGGITGCGIANAVRLHEVNGIRLSTGAVVDCPTARAFGTWVERGMMPAVGNQGGGVQSIRVAASYACRTRNHQAGARISEHGRGKAIDVSGYSLRDGTEVTLLRDWGTGRNGRALRQMHRAACGTFGTVLGPESDRFHLDHFHFDTARHRGGPYCR